MPVRIEIDKVTHSFGTLPILRKVDLVVGDGDVVLIGGRSGHGKSTLLEVSAGLIKPQSGRVIWDGVDLATLSRPQLLNARLTMGYVFQQDALISNFTVFDNIALPLRSLGTLTEKEVTERVHLQLDELGLYNIERQFPEVLSAGQLKSVAVARALVRDPELLLLDEPISGVDPFTARGILNILHDRREKKKITIIMIAHNMNIWPGASTRRYLLDSGKLLTAEEYDSGDRRYIEETAQESYD